MSKYRNTFIMISNPDFSLFFLVIGLVLKIPFPDHIFLKISKYCIENLHFPSTGKYYAHPFPLTQPPYLCMLIAREQISMNVKNNLLFHKAWPWYGCNNHFFQQDKSNDQV